MRGLFAPRVRIRGRRVAEISGRIFGAERFNLTGDNVSPYTTRTMPPKIVAIQVATPTTVFTVNEAANALNIQPTVMRNYLSQGLFTSLRFKDHITFVDPKEVKNWKDEHQK